MSFDPSSYSNSDMMTSSYGDYSDMSGVTSHQCGYSNHNLLMSSIGPYSDMAQVKHVPYDPFGLQRKTVSRDTKALAWNKVREPDELDEPYSGFLSKPKPYNHLQKTLNNLIGIKDANLIGIKDASTQPIIKSSARNYAPPLQSGQKSIKTTMNENIGIKNTFAKPIIRSSAQHYLSEDERRSVKQINDPHLIALTELGDRYHEKHKYKKEADYHRKVQEKLRSDEYKNDHTHVNVASMDSYGRNSAAIHYPDYTNYYSSLGYTFDDIFKQSKPYNQYKPGERIDYIPIWIKGFYKDPLAIQWINDQCRDT